MARQNRVTPEGEIIAHPGRGLFMGNRGILHDGGGRIVAPFPAPELGLLCDRVQGPQPDGDGAGALHRAFLP